MLVLLIKGDIHLSAFIHYTTLEVYAIEVGGNTLLYLDAVEEALCFGWIDGVKKKVSETEMAQRLSPRGKKSSWTELNKERANRLEKLGLMRDEGRRVLPDRDRHSFRIDREIEQKLQEEKQVYVHCLSRSRLMPS